MKRAEQSNGTSKRPRGDAATIFGTMPATKETFVYPTVDVDPAGNAEDVDLTVAPPLSPRAMMQSLMTTQAAHGRLLDEFLTEVASFRVDFMDYRSAFPPPLPFED